MTTLFFFFQAEDGIRDLTVTGVQTCALPISGSASLYFHQNPYTPDGQKLIITTPTGLSAINLKTRAIEKIVEGRVGVIIVGRKTGQVYYTKSVRNNNSLTVTVYATDLNTKATHEIVKLPPGASVSAGNADETLLAGIIYHNNAA